MEASEIVNLLVRVRTPSFNPKNMTNELTVKSLSLKWDKGSKPYKVMSDGSRILIELSEYNKLFTKLSNEAISKYIENYNRQ